MSSFYGNRSSGGGGGGDSYYNDLFVKTMNRTISDFNDRDSLFTGLGNNAFHGCGPLTSVNFPACTSIGDQAFYG